MAQMGRRTERELRESQPRRNSEMSGNIVNLQKKSPLYGEARKKVYLKTDRPWEGKAIKRRAVHKIRGSADCVNLRKPSEKTSPKKKAQD